MESSKKSSTTFNFLMILKKLLSDPPGNTMLYLLVLLLIFSVLGFSMVSLFSTAVTSSATPNYSRRAFYMAESGIRYALSTIRNGNFHDNFIQSLNNTPSYTLTNDGLSFSINIFSPWFEYSSISGSDLTLNVPNAGEIPENFSIPNITLVHWNNFKNSPPNPPPPDSWEPITGSSATAEDTSLTITIANPASFTVSTDDIVCLAVQPTNADPASPLQAGEDIYVALDAENVFPPSSGAIRIVTNDGQSGDYFYTELIPDTSNNRARLTNLAALPGATSFTEISNFSTDDWVVLSRQNYRLLASGTSGDVTVEIGNDSPLNIFSDAGVYTINMADLVADAVVKESDIAKSQFDIDAGVDKKITIGGSGPAFGDLWYGGEKPIGGDSTFCQEGRCLLGIGIRAFFTLYYSGDGEGFIFPLISAGGEPPENTFNSVGGDIKQSELLGYAGDSRTTPGGAPFLDGTGAGLLPPKIGFEFDTRIPVNFDQDFETTLGYCDNLNQLKANTRNDPKPGGNDEYSVQNVFWGNTVLDIPCRGDHQSYDDNRHEAEDIRQKWTFGTAGAVISSPAIGDDGTIYVGSNDNNVYAINSDGSAKGGNWPFVAGGSIRSSPAIGVDGTIYVGSGDGNVYAINPDGSSKGGNWPFPAGGQLMSSPAIDLTGGPHDGTIYIGVGDQVVLDDGKLIAINPDGTQKWVFLAEGLGDDDMDSSPAVGDDSTIYIGSDDNHLYAVNPADGSKKWDFPTIHNIESKPAIDESNNTVYVESESFKLYALNRETGALLWEFDLGGFNDSEIDSSPVIDVDGTVYIGAKDTNVRAINPDERKRHFDFGDRPFPTESEWIFSTGAEVRSTPAINPSDKTVYVGSNNSNLYAFNQIAVPRNFRDELIISDDFPSVTFTTPAEWLKEGPWAVRMEVIRSNTADADGNFTYTLKTWVEQCQSADCSDFLSLLFRDTLVEYNVAGRPNKLEQTIKLSGADHDKFERFLFGFTTAAQSSDTQQAIIRNFELSFSRSGDPVVTVD